MIQTRQSVLVGELTFEVVSSARNRLHAVRLVREESALYVASLIDARARPPSVGQTAPRGDALEDEVVAAP